MVFEFLDIPDHMYQGSLTELKSEMTANMRWNFAMCLLSIREARNMP